MKLTKLDEIVRNMLSSRDAFRKKPFSKKQLTQFIVERQRDHLVILQGLDGLSDKTGKRLAATLNAGELSNYPLYVNFLAELNAEQKKSEKADCFSTLIEANRKFVEIMTTLETDVNTLFQQDRISLLNMRMTHVVVAGVLYQSEHLATFTKYMVSYVSSKVNELDRIPPYRSDFLLQNAGDVAMIVNTVNVDSGAVDYRALIKKIQANAADYTLVNSTNAESQIGVIESVLELGKDEAAVVKCGALGVPGFRAIGELLNVITSNIRKGIRDEERWLQSHVALLRDRMLNTDPDSVEYKNLKRTVERYEPIIDNMARVREKMEQ